MNLASSEEIRIFSSCTQWVKTGFSVTLSIRAYLCPFVVQLLFAGSIISERIQQAASGREGRCHSGPSQATGGNQQKYNCEKRYGDMHLG